MIFKVFLPYFSFVSLEEFFLNSFCRFGCWDETRHLPPILEWIHGSSPFDLADFSHFPQNLGFLSSSKIGRGSFGFGKKSLWELVPCVEAILVSKFHSILCLIAQESWLGKKGLVLSKNYAQFWVDRTSLSQFPDKSRTIWGGLVWVWGRTSPDWVFQPEDYSLFLPYFTNRMSNWSRSFSATFISSWGSFLHYWLVCSSPYYRVLVWVWIWDIGSSCKRIWLGSRSPPF
jgi:hypothetical protein